MIEIEVGVSERLDEFAGGQPGHLRHHHRQQRVGGDVERNAEKDVGRALIELTGEAAVSHVELEKAVAGRKRHPGNVGGIPGSNDQAPGIRITPYLLHDPVDLVERFAVSEWPGPPLFSVNGAEFAILVGPFVPDAYPVLAQPAHVGFASQEPQKFVDDRLDVQLLGREQREAGGKIEAHLVTEHGDGARARAVALLDACLENSGQKVVVLTHMGPTRVGSHLSREGAQMPGSRRPSMINPQALYSEGRFRPAMAINGCAISGPDPGAVPGASTTDIHCDVCGGGETGSTDV